jgi:beta-glucosidase
MDRMWLDGKLIVEDATLHDPNTQTATVELTGGHRYSVKVECLRGGFGTKLVWLPITADPISEAASAARQADVVVAVVGITSKLEGEEMKVDVPGFRAPASTCPRKSQRFSVL